MLYFIYSINHKNITKKMINNNLNDYSIIIFTYSGVLRTVPGVLQDPPSEPKNIDFNNLNTYTCNLFL